MTKKVEEFCALHQLISKGDTIVVGISGGPDSMALLHYLITKRLEMQLNIQVVHINHQIRGREADLDTQLVELYCEQKQVNCHVFYRNIPEIAKAQSISEEEAGRQVRYALFHQVGADNGRYKIAVAHHGDDQAETMLHHFIRGSGVEGLRGMLPQNQNIIRPFLTLTKDEIYHYLELNQIPYREDASNQSNDYTRNKIRNQIMPLIQSLNPNFTHAMLRLSQLMRSIEEDQDALLALHFSQIVSVDGEEVRLNLALLHEQPVSMQRLVLRQAYQKLTGHKNNLEAKHIEQMRQLMVLEGNKQIDLPNKITCSKSYGNLIIHSKSKKELDPIQSFEILPGTYPLANGQMLEVSCFDIKDMKNFQENKYTKIFDYDKMVGTLIFRTRQSGDYFSFGSDKHKKKLKEYMIDVKISHTMRGQIPVIALENHVLWLVGYVRTSEFDVDALTKRILQIKMI